MTRDDSRWPLSPLVAVGVAVSSVAILMIGCGEELPRMPAPVAVESDASPGPVEREPPQPPPPRPPRVTYRAVLIEGMESLRQLQSELGSDGFSVVLKVNRRDIGHVRQGENLVVPSRTDDLIELSPFPRTLPSVQAVTKLMLVSQTVQAFAAYEAGDLVRWGTTSTGRPETPTPNGLLHTNWKSKQRRSTVDGSWLLNWYFNLDNARGVSFHEFDLPGYPASHACIRLLTDDAEWIYGWAEQWTLTPDERQIVTYGTPVVIFGEFDHDSEPPWALLDRDPTATTITAEDAEKQIQPYLSTIFARAQAGRNLSD